LNRWLHQKRFRYFAVHWTLRDMTNNCKSNPDVCAVWNSMLIKSNDPPFRCVQGCSHFFRSTPAQQWPAVLKRPYRRGKDSAVPEDWWNEYLAALRLDRPKFVCNRSH
jgi:hypothetical protein